MAIGPGEDAGLLLVFAIRSRSLWRRHTCVDRLLLFRVRGSGDSVDQRMFRGQDHIRCAVERIGTGGEDGEAKIFFVMLVCSFPGSRVRCADVPSGGTISKSTCAPSLRPIQFRCISFKRVGPVQISRSLSRRSA